MELEVSLVEWSPDGRPTLLGVTDDPDLVERVRAHLAAERERDLERLTGRRRPRLRPVPDPEGDPPAAP